MWIHVCFPKLPIFGIFIYTDHYNMMCQCPFLHQTIMQCTKPIWNLGQTRKILWILKYLYNSASILAYRFAMSLCERCLQFHSSDPECHATLVSSPSGITLELNWIQLSRSVHTTPQLCCIAALHRNCGDAWKLKFILTWNAVKLQWFLAKSNWYIGTTTQLGCNVNKPSGICCFEQSSKVMELSAYHMVIPSSSVALAQLHKYYRQSGIAAGYYTPIAFDERVTFWLQRARSLSCACAFAALYACAIA